MIDYNSNNIYNQGSNPESKMDKIQNLKGMFLIDHNFHLIYIYETKHKHC